MQEWSFSWKSLKLNYLVYAIRWRGEVFIDWGRLLYFYNWKVEPINWIIFGENWVDKSEGYLQLPFGWDFWVNVKFSRKCDSWAWARFVGCLRRI